MTNLQYVLFFIRKVQIIQDTKIEENIQTIYKNINKQLVQLVLQTPVPRLQTPDSSLHIVDSSVHTADSRLQSLDSRLQIWLAYSVF